MSAVSSRHAIDTLPIKVYCRDGSHITVKLGPLATCSDLHRALVVKVRGMKEQMILKDSDPLLRYFAVYTVTSESFLERLRNPTDNVWTVKEEFQLTSDHFEFARLVARSPALIAPVPCIPLASTSLRSIKDGGHVDDDLAARMRNSLTAQGPQSAAKRSASPRPVSGAPPSLSSSRRARSDVDAIAKYNMERAAQMGATDEPESSDETFTSPPTSPRPSTTAPTSPRSSPKRLRRMSIGGTTTGSAAITNLTMAQTPASSGSVPQLSHVNVPAKVDSTLLWADFLEATHLVATCPLFRPKEPMDVTELASLHFYIFSLQSPPSESSSRKEKTKTASTGRESGNEKNSTSASVSGGLSVHIEESPALSKTYRKALHRNMGAFFPVRLQQLYKHVTLEEAVWLSYVDLVGRKLTVEDGMQEYTRIFNRWRYSDVRLFFEVKREVSALMTPKSSILAINEDGIAILKKDKENELVASYLYSNMANWTVIGNTITLEMLPDDPGASGLAGTTLQDAIAGVSGSGSTSKEGNSSGSNSSSSGSLLQVPSAHSGSNPLLNVKTPSSSSSPLLSSNKSPGGTITPLGQPATQTTFLTLQADTIATIIQFYVDRLTSVIFERAEVLRVQPSPRIFLLTDIASGEPSVSEHRIAVESLAPALNQLKEERSKSSGLSGGSNAHHHNGHPSNSQTTSHHDGLYSSTSDSDRETNIYHSGSVDALSGPIKRSSSSNTNREGILKGDQGGSGGNPPSSPSSPSLGRRRAPSMPRSQMEASRLELLRVSASEATQSSDEGPQGVFTSSQDGPRRSGSKKRSANHRLTSSRQSDTDTAKGSESDREKLTVSLGIPTDGSESDQQMPSRPDSPSPHLDLDLGPISSFSDTASTSTL